MTEQKITQDDPNYVPPPPQRTLDELAMSPELLPELDENDLPEAEESD